MATIVPISHSIRWRSRSRNSSMDSVDSQQHQQVSPCLGLHISSSNDAREWDEEPSDDDDDDDEGFDELQTSAWLVVPREFANVNAVQRSRRPSWGETPVSPLGYANSNAAKSMERRRADGSHN
ncbi:hypothetical protein Gpo141_00003882 [Globisporangium polare]